MSKAVVNLCGSCSLVYKSCKQRLCDHLCSHQGAFIKNNVSAFGLHNQTNEPKTSFRFHQHLPVDSQQITRPARLRKSSYMCLYPSIDTGVVMISMSTQSPNINCLQLVQLSRDFWCCAPKAYVCKHASLNPEPKPKRQNFKPKPSNPTS